MVGRGRGGGGGGGGGGGPLEIQVSKPSSYTGRASYVVFILGTDCDTPYFRLAIDTHPLSYSV